MNKQELIERIEGLKNLFGNKAEYIEIDTVIELISKLHEPQKVVVPQFVDGYIKYAKEVGWNLLEAMKNVPYEDNAEFRKWFYKGSNVEVFARAWLDGYTVEKEKQHTVKFKNIQRGTEYLKYDRVVERWYFGLEDSSIERTMYHTRKELEEAGFGWVFDCPGIEIEEVEE